MIRALLSRPLLVAAALILIAMLIDAAKKDRADKTINKVLDTINRGIDAWQK